MKPRDPAEDYRHVVRGTLSWAALNTVIVSALAVAILRCVADMWPSGPALAFGCLVASVAALFFFNLIRSSVRGVSSVLRFRGYPAHHWQVARGTLRWAMRIEVFWAVLALSLTGLAVGGNGLIAEIADDGASFVVAILLVLVLPMCVFGTDDVLCCATVVPYFDREVGEIDTFGKGEHLARHMVELDALARELGVPPLSAFGWNDDFAGEPLVWHEAAVGLKTVKALLVRYQGDEFAEGKAGKVIEDLKRVAHALTRAAERGIRFCLLLRHANATNAMEWEQRRGTCF